MGEVDKRTESDGKGLFIIRNGQKIAKYKTEKWVPLIPGVVVRITPDGIKIEMPRQALAFLTFRRCCNYFHVRFTPKSGHVRCN
jgi:hypothetical protein